ncbi:MAG: diguanylate cyclase [Actinobacteria bacterium]|nr:diguanylate cyclase [Actinomycetota bacterium]
MRLINKFNITKRELLSEDIFYSLTNIVRDAIIVTDSYRKVVYWNKAAEKIFNFTSGEILGKSVGHVLPQDILSIDEKYRLKNKEKFQEVIGRKKNNIKMPLEISISTWQSGNGLFFTIIVRDITVRKNTEEKLRYLSFHDNLTGLYNRFYFDEELKRLDTVRQLPLSIIIGDLDGFKLVNDAFGYKEGDELLKNFAGVLKESCRSDDILARWGGDEFVIMLPKTEGKVTKEIIERIENNSRVLGTGEIPLNISLGFFLKDKPEQNIETVIKEAENAMKQKKIMESKRVSSTIIASIEKKLHEKSHRLREVNERIEKTAVLLGKALKLSRSEMDNLHLLVSFHDVGIVGIKGSILNKKSKLIDKEWQVVMMHPEIGYRIAKSSAQLAPIADAILAHHEFWDGSGYPYHLKGNKIPLISRILSIVESYDAMVYGRNYKKPMTREEAIKELKRFSRKQFDPQLVEKFIGIITHEAETPSLFELEKTRN